MAVPEIMTSGATYERTPSTEEPSTPVTSRSVDSTATPASLRSPPLEGLAAHGSKFQLDEFNRSKLGSSASKSLGKLLAFARSPKPGPGGKSSSGDASGAASGAASGNVSLTTDGMLLFSDEPIPTSLLRHASSDDASRAVKLFSLVQQYAGVRGAEPPSPAAGADLLAKLLHQGLKRPALRDELYLQLVKQTRGCPNARARARAWGALVVVAHAFPPTAEFVGLVSEYVHGAAEDAGEQPEVAALARRAWGGLKRVARAGARRSLPDQREILTTLAGKPSTAVVHFLDGAFEEVQYDAATTVGDAVQLAAAHAGLEHFQTFSLYAVPRGQSIGPSRAVGGGSPARPFTGAGAAPAAPERALDDARYLADVLEEAARQGGSSGGGSSSSAAATRAPPRLLFKKRLFRETDEDISEPRFVSLSFVQALADHAGGAYPVSREDAAELAALGALGSGQDPGVGAGDAAVDAVLDAFAPPAGATAGLPRAEARADVRGRLDALRPAVASREEAALAFLRIVRGLPYGGAAFYPAARIEDPIGLLPARLLLAVNRRGVHFFRPVPKEYLHSAELRDIMQFGSSSTAVFFKMRVAGVLHVFQFETPAGEDICLALQTHINDVMARRYARAEANGGGAGAVAPSGTAGPSAFGPQYAAHVSELQRALDDARADLKARDSRVAELDAERSELAEELDALRRADASIGGGGLGAAGGLLPRGAAATDGTIPTSMASGAAGAVALTALSQRLREAEAARELAELRLTKAEAAAVAAAESAATGGVERQARADADAARSDADAARQQLAARDAKVNELVEALGDRELLLSAAREELAESKGAREELVELRELKEDVERRERAQAEVVAAQARRLEELERLYREEVVARKRAHNAVEDLKGKIRVYARVRPLLEFERQRGQAQAVDVPDALSISFSLGDRKREYSYDAVFDGATGQEAVFADVKHLVQSAIDGYNVCIFAYGQTGSGKTHTIYGSDELPGITPRATAELFNLIDRAAGRFAVRVEATMLELYCDDLSDLLADAAGGAAGGAGASTTPSRAGGRPGRLEIKKDPRGVVTVPGATVVEVRTASEAARAIEQGMARRRVSETKMNTASSRSHLVITLLVESTNLQTQAVSRGKLSFVDLAGSERVKKSGSEGAQLKEAQAINKSLAALGNVISALATEQAHVPYRDHKLTMLMSDSIGGTAKTLMFVNVSPVDANLDETNNSLQYATRVSAIRNDVTKNEANKDILRLQKQVGYWKDQAGVPLAQRDYVDLLDIKDEVQNVQE